MALENEIAILERQLSSAKTEGTKKLLSDKIGRLKVRLEDASSKGEARTKVAIARTKVKQMPLNKFKAYIKQLAKKPQYKFLKGLTTGQISDDKKRVAKPVGWRFSGRENMKKPTKAEIREGKKDGSVYYENRSIRSDVSRAIRLENGGVSGEGNVQSANGGKVGNKKLLEQDFDKIKKSKLFNSIYLNEDNITIEGGQSAYFTNRNYQNENFGTHFEVKDVIKDLKKITDRNYNYTIKKQVIGGDDFKEDWDEKETREDVIFTLIPKSRKYAKGTTIKGGGGVENPSITITKDYYDEKGDNSKKRPLKYSVNYLITFDGGNFIELTGTLTAYHTGRDYDYEFEVNYFADQNEENYYDENNEKIEQEIIDKFYSLGKMANGGGVESEEEEMDWGKLSDVQEELGRLYRWKNQYGSSGADGKIKQLEERVEYLKSNKDKTMAEGGGVGSEVYIEFLNKEKGFKKDVKYFNSYNEAVEWAKKNFDKFNPDMIKYKFEKGGKTRANRPSPSVSATSVSVGTQKTGNDGNIYEAKADKNGVQRWVRVAWGSEQKEKSKSNVESKLDYMYGLAVRKASDWEDGDNAIDKLQLANASEWLQTLPIIRMANDSPLDDFSASVKNEVKGKPFINMVGKKSYYVDPQGYDYARYIADVTGFNRKPSDWEEDDPIGEVTRLIKLYLEGVEADNNATKRSAIAQLTFRKDTYEKHPDQKELLFGKPYSFYTKEYTEAVEFIKAFGGDKFAIGGTFKGGGNMNVENCERCNQPTGNATTMSMFNEDVICMSCKEKEKQHPDYKKAVDTDIAEIKKGNYNFKGIGKDVLEVELGSTYDAERKSGEDIALYRRTADSLHQAQMIVSGFITWHNVGASTWIGGDVYKNGKLYKRISYNGKLHDIKMGAGGTSDSAEDMGAPMISGTMESSMETGGKTESFTKDAQGNYKNSAGYELIDQFDGTYQVLDPNGMDIAGEYETLEQGKDTISGAMDVEIEEMRNVKSGWSHKRKK